MGSQNYGIDPAVATQIARDIAEVQSLGVETAIVIGGGNIFRGVAASARGMDRLFQHRHRRRIARDGDQGRRDPQSDQS